MPIADLYRCDDMPIVMLTIPAGATHRTLLDTAAFSSARRKRPRVPALAKAANCAVRVVPMGDIKGCRPCHLAWGRGERALSVTVGDATRALAVLVGPRHCLAGGSAFIGS